MTVRGHGAAERARGGGAHAHGGHWRSGRAAPVGVEAPQYRPSLFRAAGAGGVLASRLKTELESGRARRAALSRLPSRYSRAPSRSAKPGYGVPMNPPPPTVMPWPGLSCRRAAAARTSRARQCSLRAALASLVPGARPVRLRMKCPGRGAAKSSAPAGLKAADPGRNCARAPVPQLRRLGRDRDERGQFWRRTTVRVGNAEPGAFVRAPAGQSRKSLPKGLSVRRYPARGRSTGRLRFDRLPTSGCLLHGWAPPVPRRSAQFPYRSDRA